LAEEGADIQLPVQWASQFSRYWSIDRFVTVVLEAIDNIQKRGTTYKSMIEDLRWSSKSSKQ
jgi:hypothetical protein